MTGRGGNPSRKMCRSSSAALAESDNGLSDFGDAVAKKRRGSSSRVEVERADAGTLILTQKDLSS